MGALVTLQLPSDSPLRALPWIITFGPLTDAEDWEPVVCGPYERPHALALAEEIVADEELMAVVEPLLGYAAPEEIREEIALARATAESDAEFAAGTEGEGAEFADADAFDGAVTGLAPDVEPSSGEPPGVLALPTPAEVRAGMARVVRQLAD